MTWKKGGKTYRWRMPKWMTVALGIGLVALAWIGWIHALATTSIWW